MAGKGQWERLWLANKLLSVKSHCEHAWWSVLGHGTLSWAGVPTPAGGQCVKVSMWKE